MMNKQIIFDVIRSGYSKLAYASDEEILQYFEQISEDEIEEHIHYIRSLLYEVENLTSTQGKHNNEIEKSSKIKTDKNLSDTAMEQLLINLLFSGLFGL